MNPYLNYAKHLISYQKEPSPQNLFTLCNVSANCYNYKSFSLYSKEFFDLYGLTEISAIYPEETEEEIKVIYDAMLAEFIVKAIIYEHYSNDVLINYFIDYKSNDSTFSKLFIKDMETYCKNDGNQRKIINFLFEMENNTQDVTSLMIVYTIQFSIFEIMKDKENLNNVIMKQRLISEQYYASKQG